jgi:hypothetical protein
VAVLTFARVASVVLLGAFACYDPVLRDCTVACAGSGACANGQVCERGWCVEDPATTCTAAAGPDAGNAANPDAVGAPLAVLHVVVMGPGEVAVDGAKPCTDDCTYEVAYAVPHQLAAAATGNHRFQMWSGACNGSAATCELTIAMAPIMPGAMMTTVDAQFAAGP